MGWLFSHSNTKAQETADIVYGLKNGAGPRKGWHVTGPGGMHYRMSARQLSEALRGA